MSVHVSTSVDLSLSKATTTVLVLHPNVGERLTSVFEGFAKRSHLKVALGCHARIDLSFGQRLGGRLHLFNLWAICSFDKIDLMILILVESNWELYMVLYLLMIAVEEDFWFTLIISDCMTGSIGF